MGDWFEMTRPTKGLLLVLAGSAFVSLQGWIRLGLSIQNWYLYQSLGVYPGVWYFFLTGLLTGFIYLTVTGYILFYGRRSRKIPIILLFGGLAVYWFDRIFAAITPESRTNLPFSLVYSSLMTLIAVIILYWDTILSKGWKQEKRNDLIR
jgi:hypothetical protein